MSDHRVRFITGANRGMGASFVRAALDAGDAGVAGARRVADVDEVFAGEPNVLAVPLDVTSADAATAAAEAAVERHGRVDVLVNSAGASFKGYFERSATQRAWWQAQDGQQGGDPDKLARALVAVSREQPPPRRFIAGADVIALAERKIAELRADIQSHLELSQSLTFGD